MTLHWITIVWGEEYTAHFLKLVIPNLLSPLNLPNCCVPGSIFKIYTTSQDAETIRKSTIFSKLTKIVVCQILTIEDALDTSQSKEQGQANVHMVGKPLSERNLDKYFVMNHCHRHAIRAARETPDVAFVFLSPDAIYSDGSFTNMLRIAQSGKRAIMVPGLRLVKDTFTPMFLRNYYREETQTATISSRELARHAMAFLHPMMDSCFWNSADFGEWASVLLWTIPHEGFLARCFHLHPVFVRPLDRDALPSSTIDGAYLVRACPNFADIHVVEDSDEMLCMETTKMTASNPLTSKTPQVATPRLVGRFAYRVCDKHHRTYFKRKMRIHCADISPAWKPFEDQSDNIMKSVLIWHKMYVGMGLFPAAWLRQRIWSLREKIRPRTRLKKLLGRFKALASGVSGR